MSDKSKQDALRALEGVTDPISGRNIVAAGMVGGLVVRGDEAGFALDIGDRDPASMEPLRQACETALRQVPSITKTRVVLTAERRAPAPPDADTRRRQADIRAIIAVASGKGGVGKSTVAVNLALGLAALGLRTGLLDADIYGPSVPRLLGLSGKPDSDGKKLKPKSIHGIKAMSIGLLVDVDTPMIWRGPMATSALQQMLTDVDWGALDVLVVDMPPGTGDIQLSLAQRVPLAGAVIVSTPQDIALIDARKGLAMFRKVHVPILGLVENMSTFVCPHCGTTTDIFGHGGARETAARLDAPFLGAVPLHLAIRETSDAGTPIVRAAPDSAQARAFLAIAEQVAAQLQTTPQRAAPTISMD
ncbi:MAG: iron-sulfur cluster carrier protein ApbC [Alphaproteobacteria bacterium]|nr:MAG: iron-sulfur cluster carrier protein ApbC [Alphaproteobacteria bacterium]